MAEVQAGQRRYLDALFRPSICGVMRFPVGPTGGVDQSADYDSDHPDYDWAFHACAITPRTAEALRTEGCILSDEIDELGDECLPPRLRGHGKPFRDKFIERVERIGRRGTGTALQRRVDPIVDDPPIRRGHHD